MSEILEILKEVSLIDCGDDIKYEILKASEIMSMEKYAGVSVSIKATIFRTRRVFKVDVAAASVVTPGPIKHIYKSILDVGDFEVVAYNKETIVAEKLHAILSRGVLSSRYKDLYDIVLFYNDANIDLEIVKSAVKNTFAKRNLILTNEKIRLIISETETSINQRQGFEGYLNVKGYASHSTFADVIMALRYFAEILNPIFEDN